MKAECDAFDLTPILFDAYLVHFCEYLESFRCRLRENCFWIGDDLSLEAVRDLMGVQYDESQSKSNGTSIFCNKSDKEKEEDLGKAINRSEGVN